MAGLIAILRTRALVTLMLGHFQVDCYVGVIPVLFPLLIGRFDLDLATVGLVSLAYGGTASLSQPFFGFLADRFGTRFTGLALVWTASSFAAIGFAPTFPILVAIAAEKCGPEQLTGGAQLHHEDVAAAGMGAPVCAFGSLEVFRLGAAGDENVALRIGDDVMDLIHLVAAEISREQQ